LKLALVVNDATFQQILSKALLIMQA